MLNDFHKCRLPLPVEMCGRWVTVRTDDSPPRGATFAPVLLYIDPGSGSLIVQAIIGGVLGVAFFFKDLKRRAVALFGKKKESDDTDAQSTSADATTRDAHDAAA